MMIFLLWIRVPQSNIWQVPVTLKTATITRHLPPMRYGKFLNWQLMKSFL